MARSGNTRTKAEKSGYSNLESIPFPEAKSTRGERDLARRRRHSLEVAAARILSLGVQVSTVADSLEVLDAAANRGAQLAGLKEQLGDRYQPVLDRLAEADLVALDRYDVIALTRLGRELWMGLRGIVH